MPIWLLSSCELKLTEVKQSRQHSTSGAKMQEHGPKVKSMATPRTVVIRQYSSLQAKVSLKFVRLLLPRCSCSGRNC